jgi:integrative and conjugative element protein (TIGR02256 family)
VVIARDAYDDLVNAGADALPNETGGVLVGFRSANRVVVTRVLPVSDAASTGISFRLSVSSAQRAVDDLRPDAGAHIGFVGDWHIHPADSPPSAMDTDSLTKTGVESEDLIALVVLPFHDGIPRPGHALIAGGGRRGFLRRRRQPQIHRASFEVTDMTGVELEALAERSLDPRKENQ